MYSDSDLDQAVTAGVLPPQLAADFRHYVAAQRAAPAADEEHFRFLTGFFGSPVLATGGATIADLYKPSKRPYALAIYGMANVLGPVLGPLVGGFAAQAKGWKCKYCF